MPKPHTFPTLLDECKSISITSLKDWGYLLPFQVKAGTIHWSRNGERYASISIQVNMSVVEPYLELTYRCNNVPISYRIGFVSKASNLGKGRVWFFRCPHTGKLCRKLYMIQTYFLHMKAFRGAMYEKQTYSKHARSEIRLFDRIFKSEKAFELLHAKSFKKHYKGVPTKRYSRLQELT